MPASALRCRLAFTIAFFAVLAAPAFAQQSETEALASRVAETIRQSKRQSAVVLNFVGTRDAEGLELGRRLAEEIDQVLRNKSAGFRLIDRQYLQKVAKRLSSKASADAMSSLWVGQQAGAEIVITGRVESASGAAELLVRLWDTTNEDTRELGQIRLRLPPSKEIDEFLARTAHAASESRPAAVLGQPSDSAPASGKGPAEDSSKYRVVGIVELRMLLMPDGRAGSVVLRKGLGMGLDEEAIENVRKWKFKPPPPGFGGKPVAIPVFIDVSFRLK